MRHDFENSLAALLTFSKLLETMHFAFSFREIKSPIFGLLEVCQREVYLASKPLNVK